MCFLAIFICSSAILFFVSLKSFISHYHCTRCVQEEAEVPDDEQLNDMIARNEEELDLFIVSEHAVFVLCCTNRSSILLLLLLLF